MKEWKKIEGYEGLYMVSSDGEVKRMERKVYPPNGGVGIMKERILKGNANTSGYYRVFLSKDSKVKTKYIHRLVAKHFINNNNNNYKEINHINGIKEDNRVENLEWVTREENVRHALINNLSDAVLTTDEVDEILSRSEVRAKDFAKKFEVSESTIFSIRSGRTWSSYTGIK